MLRVRSFGTLYRNQQGHGHVLRKIVYLPRPHLGLASGPGIPAEPQYRNQQGHGHVLRKIVYLPRPHLGLASGPGIPAEPHVTVMCAHGTSRHTSLVSHMPRG